MKKLSDITNTDLDILIKDIKTDSREVKKGDLFVAVTGYYVDHNDYIKDAIKNGAVAIVTSKTMDVEVPVIEVSDLDSELINICKKMYDYNDDNILIGVTGTDGKTTTATLIKEIITKFSKIAYIGTNGVDIGYNIPTDNTTPKVEKLYKYFMQINKENINTISMEVSSEALLHGRVDSLLFKYAVFTNITEDHLNVHKSLENYINSKLKLLDLVKKDGYIIVNGDDQVLNKIDKDNVIKFGKGKHNDFIICNQIYDKLSTTFFLKHNNQLYKIKSSLIGEFNIYNLTAAFIVCYLEKIPVDDIIRQIETIHSIKGRVEKIDCGQKYDIIIDYAHTLNGIKNVVESLKKNYKKIIVVTGAAGEREKEKRKYIGKYLLDNVNKVIFTMDDPRSESVDAIIDDMLELTNKKNYKRIISRESAIKYALDSAKKEELVLILGKGRDNYMAIGNRKVKYSDYEVIKKYFDK